LDQILYVFFLDVDVKKDDNERDTTAANQTQEILG
jgi:hypothetical protein